MTTIVASVGLGLLTNLIYDIAKNTLSKFSDKFNSSKLKAEIETKLNKPSSDDIRPMLESSTFVKFFSSAQFLDVINAYVEHKIICDYTCKNSKIKKFIQKSSIISAQDVIKYISNKINGLYHENKEISSPSLSCIENAVAHIIYVTEQTVSESLSPETSRLLYFINSRIDFCYEEITKKLSAIQKTIEGIQSKHLSPKNNCYDEIRTKYHNILKDKNSDAHIYLLDKFPFEKFYVPPILQRVSNERDQISILDMYDHIPHQAPTIEWNDIFRRENIVYLTGGAGYGKSLFTKNIINNYVNLNTFYSQEYLVICGELKAFFPNGSDSAISVIDFLKNSIKSSTLLDVSSEFIEHYLDSGRCIILLDALDEVDKSKRASLHETIVAFFKNQNPNNKICITSRDRGFIPEKNIEVYKICPLNEEQIEKYVDKIIALGKFEEGDKEAFMQQTKILIEKGFLNSFLVLSLLINIYKAERELPENKLELYQKCFEYIANKREKEKTQKDFDWRVISPIMKDNTFIELSRMGMPNNSNIDKKDIKDLLLQVYKTKYVSEAETENAIDEFLKFCSDRTELFVPTSEDKFKFFHRSFFEYFYSLYIFLRCNDVKEMLEELYKFDVDSEVFELTVAMLKQQSEKKYQDLLDLMFIKTKQEFQNGSCDFSTFNILILSMQVVDDALYRKDFLEILLLQKDVILKNQSKIHNLRLVSDIFENDFDSNCKICEAYNDECMLTILNSLENILEFFDKYKKEHGKDFIKDLSSNDNEAYKMSRIFYRHHGYYYFDSNSRFYVDIYSKIYNCQEKILAFTDEEILRVYKKYSHYNYKKRSAKMRILITKFSKFKKEVQVHITNLIISAGLGMAF
ncbi:MAG: NACHT domain-containing protein [Clostridia bacterium]|nr:NACHT domain-containing protein [Clostridia bacterium]